MTDTTNLFAELEMVIDHLNNDHDDTTLFIVRHLAHRDHHVEHASLVTGRLTTISRSGIHALGTTVDGDELPVFWPFGDEPTSLDEVRGQMFGLLTDARNAASDDVPLTSLERELTGADGIATRVAEVVAVADINPELRQITIGGLQGTNHLGGDEFWYLLLPPPGRSELTVGEDFTWTAYDEMPVDDRPVGAYYTVRRSRPERGEIDIWCVLHDHSGHASDWAATVEVGAPLAVWGPRRAYEPPPHTSQYLLVVDETGVSAAAAILDELAEHQPVVEVIAETSSPNCTVDLPTWPGLTVRWLFRGDTPAGTSGELLDAVAELDLDPTATYAFGAAESREITEVRTLLRHRAGFPADQVSMTGYWRRER